MNSGGVVLSFAARDGYKEIVKFLFDRRVDFDIVPDGDERAYGNCEISVLSWYSCRYPK